MRESQSSSGSSATKQPDKERVKSESFGRPSKTGEGTQSQGHPPTSIVSYRQVDQKTKDVQEPPRDQALGIVQRPNVYAKVQFHVLFAGRLYADCDLEPRAPPKLQEVSLAVLGAATVGKSTFIQCSLDLKRVSVSPISSKKVSLEGKLYVVRLFELDLDQLDMTTSQALVWPQILGKEHISTVDGVLALFDVRDRSSIQPIPAILSESFSIAPSSLSCVEQHACGPVDSFLTSAHARNCLGVDP